MPQHSVNIALQNNLKKYSKEHIKIKNKIFNKIFVPHHRHPPLCQAFNLITPANWFFIPQPSAILRRACQLFFNNRMISKNIRKSNTRSSQIKAHQKLLDSDV